MIWFFIYGFNYFHLCKSQCNLSCRHTAEFTLHWCHPQCPSPVILRLQQIATKPRKRRRHFMRLQGLWSPSFLASRILWWIFHHYLIFTARNSSCGKVMSSQASVSYSVHGVLSGGRGRYPKGKGGRYQGVDIWGSGIPTPTDTDT